MMNNGVKRPIVKRQIVDGLKQGANSLMTASDPKYMNNEDPRLKQFRQDRKVSLNKTNQAFYNQNGSQVSQSLKRNQNLQYSNINNNPWSTNKMYINRQQPYYNGQIQYPSQLQNSYEDQQRSSKLKNPQVLPQLTQSPQKSSIKYQSNESEKKNEFYQNQLTNQLQLDKGIHDQNYGINKVLNNSKTVKQSFKTLANEKGSTSKDNILENSKKEYQFPLIPKQIENKQIVQQDPYTVKATDHISSIGHTQNRAYLNFDQQQKQEKQYDQTLQDCQKENQYHRGNDFIIHNKIITKNNTLSMNPKATFSSTPINNSANNNTNTIKSKEEDKNATSKDSQIKQNISTNNNNNIKDHLEEKLEKIFDSVKNTQIPQNSNNNMPPKIPKKDVEDKENKERWIQKEETTLNQNENKSASRLQRRDSQNLRSKIQENEVSALKTEQNEQGLERKPSFSIKTKNEQQIMNPLVKYYKYDFDFSKYNFSFSKRSAAGLNNIGNTCFMNSALQCVFNTPVFNEFFFSTAFEKDINPKNKGVAQSYSSLIKQVRSTGMSSSQAPYSLKKSIERVSSQFYGTDQQDAQELLRCLLDGLHEDLNRVRTKPKYRELEADINKRGLQEISDDWYQYYKGRDDSIVTDFFSGQFLSKVICSKCNNQSLAFDNFMDLSLSFSKGQENEADLVDLLLSFLKEENLDDDYYCSKCKARTKSRRSFELYKLPQILVIHLKRFNFGRFNRGKISSSVSFPVTNFDLSKFIQTSNDPSAKNSKYELYGIVNHSGSLSGGHYTAESLNPFDGKWYNFNDSHAGQISQESINRYQTSGRSSPYLLFYCKSELLLPYMSNGSDHQRMKSNL